MSTPLVDWLRAQDDATLAALVRLRPDLTVPPPADLTVLATRAGVRASVHRACDDLDTPTLAVLEALVVADADQAPVPRAEVARLLGPDVPADALDTALATLRARALVWEAEGPTRRTPRMEPMPPPRRRGHGAAGGGWGGGARWGGDARWGGSAMGRDARWRRWRAAVARRAAARRAAARGGAAARGEAGCRTRSSRPPATWCRASPAAWGARRRGWPGRRRCRRCSPRSTPTSAACSTPSPPARRSAAAARPTRAARSPGCSPRGCCCGSTRRPSSCPARSGSRSAATGRSAPSPSTRRRWTSATAAPTPSTAPRAGPRSTSCAASRRLITFWGATPPPLLRSGGVGVRDLRRAAREIDTDEPTAAFLIELAAGADLVAPSEGVTPDWLPTTQADVWLAGGPETRWSLLARTWLELPRLPGLVGRKDDAGKPINALSDGARRPLAPRDRRRVLDGLAELPPGHAAATPAQLADVLAWRAPRRGGRLRDEVVTWTLAEATTLGVVALDALSDPGRALLDRRPTGSSPRCAPPCPRRSTTCCCRRTSPRSRPARSRPGWRASSTWPPTSSPRAAPPSTGSPSRRSAARSTRAAAPPTCTTCSPPARPPRCRRG